MRSSWSTATADVPFALLLILTVAAVVVGQQLVLALGESGVNRAANVDVNAWNPARPRGGIVRRLRQLAADDGRSALIVSRDDPLEEIADRVPWLDDGWFRELAAMATDPVCAMVVETRDLPVSMGGGRERVPRGGHCYWGWPWWVQSPP